MSLKVCHNCKHLLRAECRKLVILEGRQLVLTEQLTLDRAPPFRPYSAFCCMLFEERQKMWHVKARDDGETWYIAKREHPFPLQFWIESHERENLDRLCDYLNEHWKEEGEGEP